MKTKIKVQVTERDIQRGVKQSASLCPIARAVRRVTKQKNVVVLSSQIIVGVSPDAWYITPRVARAFIARFDAGFSVSPISFTLE